jgi:hypothetical protein
MAVRAQTYEITALHRILGLEEVTALDARQEKSLVAALAERGFRHLWTIHTRTYRIGGFERRLRRDLGPLAER